MDKYIKKLRDIVQNSCKEIKTLKERKKRNSEIYVYEEAVKANEKIDLKLYDVAENSKEKIEEVRTEIIDKIQKHCVLNPKEITDDINLFNGAFDFTLDELIAYIEKYKSNYTMTNAILKYVREKGIDNEQNNKDFFIDLKTKLISKEDKEKCYNNFCDGAIQIILDVWAQPMTPNKGRHRIGNNFMIDAQVEKFGDYETLFPRTLEILESCKDY